MKSRSVARDFSQVFKNVVTITIFRRRSKGAGKSTAVEDFAIYSVDATQEAAAAGKKEDKE